MLTYKDAAEIKYELQVVSIKILRYYGATPEPLQPINRKRPWECASSKPIPKGIAFHYTGGPSGIKTLKWFNHPAWSNTVSSAHVLIFDHIPDNFIGECWSKIPYSLAQLFPVPTLLLSGWQQGTWCTNWMNRYCFGVENRNIGRNTRYMCPSTEGNFPVVNNKQVIHKCGFPWEPYTREQIICNINLGKVLNAWTEVGLDPDYILGHSAVWAIKSDPGPDFPTHLIRDAIFSPVPIEELVWLTSYSRASGNKDDDGKWVVFSEDLRDEQIVDRCVFTDEEADSLHTDEVSYDDEKWLIDRLYWLGYNCSSAELSTQQLMQFIKWFQYSTKAYKKMNEPHKVLKVDGVFGPKTKKVFKERLNDLGIEC